MRILSIVLLTTFGFATSGCIQRTPPSATKSLNQEGASGNKYYFGWGVAKSSDPEKMHREVTFDVLQTHAIFSRQLGGSYDSTRLIGREANGGAIRQHWAQLKDVMTPNDMYVQYSSGHGGPASLFVPQETPSPIPDEITYDEIRDHALALPAKEIVIFTMACHSGGLLNSFAQRKADWENWQEQGRTLLVMSSSHSTEVSASCNVADGSAFGEALWSALSGEADGYLEGVKDGYLNLGEIVEYTKAKTIELSSRARTGSHTPQVLGSYDKYLIMNRVPPKEWIAGLRSGTESLD